MKLIMAIIQDEHINKAIKGLINERIRFTKLASTGGFLKAGSTTLLIGVEDDEIDKTVDVIKANCKSTKKKSGNEEYVVGGANLFILDIDEFVKL